jgi:hypothetical protein
LGWGYTIPFQSLYDHPAGPIRITSTIQSGLKAFSNPEMSLKSRIQSSAR